MSSNILSLCQAVQSHHNASQSEEIFWGQRMSVSSWYIVLKKKEGLVIESACIGYKRQRENINCYYAGKAEP